MPIIHADFNPRFGLSNRHLQTIWPLLGARLTARLARPWQTIEHLGRPWRLELPDGDFLDLVDFDAQNRSAEKDAPQRRVLFFHGLEGNLRSHYVMPIISALLKAGFHVSFVHFRGCSGEPNRLRRGYHSGDSQEIRQLIQLLPTRPNEQRFAVGVSLGANTLLKYLGEDGAPNNAVQGSVRRPVQAFVRAVAISPPFDLRNAALTLTRRRSWFYQRYLLDSMKASMQRKFAHRDDAPLSADELDSLDSIYRFDDRITAPLHGFDSADHYYTQSSCARFLSTIRTPTRILHARDDPFMTAKAIPDEATLSDYVELYLTERGGHVGFVDAGAAWMPDQVVKGLLDSGSPSAVRSSDS